MKYWFRFAGLLCLLTIFTGAGVYGDEVVRNPLEWLNEMEEEVLGIITEGSLFDRLNEFELLLTGRTADEPLVERLSRLEILLHSNQPHDICLRYKLQALEWVLYQEGFSGPMLPRLEKLEVLLYQQNFSGPITKRLDRLISQIFPDGVIPAKWVSVPEGLLVKVKIVDELSSLKNKPGEKFKFVIAETVTIDQYVLFPKGSGGVGVLESVKKPGNLGRDARFLLDFSTVRALDGTQVTIVSGSKSLELNRTYQIAVGASAAGMLAFGPEGILFGLAVKGQQKTIPPGTEFYLQIKKSVRVYTLKKDRR